MKFIKSVILKASSHLSTLSSIELTHWHNIALSLKQWWFDKFLYENLGSFLNTPNTYSPGPLKWRKLIETSLKITHSCWRLLWWFVQQMYQFVFTLDCCQKKNFKLRELQCCVHSVYSEYSWMTRMKIKLNA